MNITQGFCPQCNSEIPAERQANGFAVCSCGWFDGSTGEKSRKQNEKKAIFGLIGSAVVLVALWGHLLNWGPYAFSIPFTKIAQLTGTLSKEGYQDLAEACIRLNKWSCAQEAYLDLYRDSHDPEGIADLAHFQVRLKEYPAAMSTYASYFKAGGKNGEAALEYAHLLEESNQADMAFKYYEASIQMRPQILPINATTAIVRLLMKQGKYEDAYQRILDFHASAGNANGYLNTELAQLEAWMASQGKLGKKHAKRVAQN